MNDEAKTSRLSLPVLQAPDSAGAGAGFSISPGDARIGVVTLGCDKNTVDSERVMARLAGAGVRASPEVQGAEVVVINTCGFIDTAKEESIETILEAVRMKEEGEIRAVVAMGCLVQRYKAELETEIPEVDLFLGLTEIDRLVPELEARGLIPPAESLVPTMERPLRLISTATTHTSFLKISEGCDHGCAFCAIPKMRGKHRSTPIERLVREAKQLEAAGVVELNIISQDTTWYGRDWRHGGSGQGPEEPFVGRPFAGLAGPHPQEAGDRSLPSAVEVGKILAEAGEMGAPGRSSGSMAAGEVDWRRGALPELLGALLDGTSIPWFRLFYMYPSGITPELVELLAREPRILPYLDMPIQHGADSVLQRMRRPERQATIRERVGWLREAIPDLVLRTTVIVGFPGETDEEFESMLELLEEIGFDHLGAFPYSREEGTLASQMPGQVPEEIKNERLERIMDLQRSISLERNEALIGRILTVLVDSMGEDGEAYGRTAGQALEVDGETVVLGADGVEPGEFVRVRITEAQEYELAGELVPEP